MIGPENWMLYTETFDVPVDPRHFLITPFIILR